MNENMPIESLAFDLPPALDVTAACALKDSLGDSLASGAAVVLGGGAVERVCTQAIQVLLAAGRDCAAARQGFALRNPSGVLAAAFGDLGLTATLEQWSRV